MIFTKVDLENFFSVGSPVSWDLKNQGLVLINGENGSGKSSLFEAIVWCLWGKTTRGQSGDAVINRKIKKDCSVHLFCKHPGAPEFVISRYRKHSLHKNALTFGHVQDDGEIEDISGGTTTITQEKVNQYLGIDYDTFIQGPMMPQGSIKLFSQMSDAEQKVVLEQALSIGVLAEAYNETKERLAVVRQSFSAAEEGLWQAEERHGELLEQRSVYEAERESWAKKKIMVLSLIAREAVELHILQEEYWICAQAADEQAADKAESSVNELKLAMHKVKDERSSVMAVHHTNLIEAKANLKQVKANLFATQTQIPKLRNLQGECPTCQQDIDEDHIESCVKELKDKIVSIKSNILDAENIVERVEEDRNVSIISFEERFDQFKYDIEILDDAYRHLLEVVDKADREYIKFLDYAKREAAVRIRLRAKREEESPYSQLISASYGAIKKQLSAVRKRKSEVRGLKLKIDHLEFWRHGFSNKGLKSYILRSVTPFLNTRAAFYSQILTKGEIIIEFRTQTTLKSGETRERFSVSVTNQNGADTYAGNSGGEKSRADLAINWTLADLMSTRSRRPYPQRFLDEPFESLDENGAEAVMDLLSGVATDAGSIFVITHMDAMKGMFDKTINVSKIAGQTELTNS